MPDAWRNLPAGPELDALVAERVLGWTNVHLAWGNVRGVPPEYADKQPPDRTVNFPGVLWSSVISSAWKVVDAMEARGYHLQLTDEWMSYPRWRAEFRSAETIRPGWNLVKADTAPLAICRAALAALEAAE